MNNSIILQALAMEASTVADHALIPNHNVPMFTVWYMRDQLVKMTGSPFYASTDYVMRALENNNLTGYGESRAAELEERYRKIAAKHDINV